MVLDTWSTDGKVLKYLVIRYQQNFTVDHKDKRKEIGQLKDKVTQLLKDNELLRKEIEKTAENALKKEHVMKN